MLECTLMDVGNLMGKKRGVENQSRCGGMTEAYAHRSAVHNLPEFSGVH